MEADQKRRRARLAKLLFAAQRMLAAVAAGCFIAAMDMRPGWDDTGVTAGALFLVSAAASGIGVPWWLAPILVAGPLIIAEFHGLGWGAVLICAIALAGAAVGAAARRAVRPASV